MFEGWTLEKAQSELARAKNLKLKSVSNMLYRQALSKFIEELKLGEKNGTEDLS